jgi:lipid A 4'-phosphatase
MGKAFKHVWAFLRCPAVWIPAGVLAAGTALFWWTDADLALVRPFFSSEGGQNSNGHWPLTFQQPWRMLYYRGEFPAWFVACAGLTAWVASFFWKKLERWRDPGLFLGLLLIIGPGVLVNLVFKPCWNRPRPRVTRPFGGDREFVPVWQRGWVKEDASFPSGHAAMGFYLMAPAFVCYRRRPWLAAGFLLLGLGSGAIIGLARIVSGSHFPSDVLWSGGIVYFTGLLLALPFRFGELATARPEGESAQ